MERYGLLLLRIAMGGGLAARGYSKLFVDGAVEAFAERLAEQGLPSADILAWVVAGVEFGGGLLVVLGLLTRVAALLCFLVMVSAVFYVHWGSTFQAMEKAVLYMAGMFSIVLLGPGTLAVLPAKRQAPDDGVE